MSGLQARRRAIYSTPPDWQPASLSDFRHLDPAFYDDATRWLIGEQFQPLGDFENAAYSRLEPDLRTLDRFFMGPAKDTVAVVFHIRTQGRSRLLEEQYERTTDYRLVQFFTEFNDATFLSTDNGKGAVAAMEYPGWVQMHLAKYAPLPSLLKLHTATASQRLVASPGVEPAFVQGTQGALSMWARLRRLMDEHWRGIGYLDEACDGARWRKVYTPDVVRLLLQEVAAHKQSAADGGDGDRTSAPSA